MLMKEKATRGVAGGADRALLPRDIFP